MLRKRSMLLASLKIKAEAALGASKVLRVSGKGQLEKGLHTHYRCG